MSLLPQLCTLLLAPAPGLAESATALEAVHEAQRRAGEPVILGVAGHWALGHAKNLAASVDHELIFVRVLKSYSDPRQGLAFQLGHFGYDCGYLLTCLVGGTAELESLGECGAGQVPEGGWQGLLLEEPRSLRTGSDAVDTAQPFEFAPSADGSRGEPERWRPRAAKGYPNPGPSAGGFRVGPASREHLAAMRFVGLVEAEGYQLAQLTLDGRVIIEDKLAIDLSLPLVAAQWPQYDFSELGLGQLRLGLRNADLGKDHEVGVELAFPVAPSALQVQGWGSLARETLPALEFMAVWQHTWRWSPRMPLTIRGGLGVRSADYDWEGSELPQREARLMAEGALAWVLGLGPRSGLVLEYELVADRNVGSARSLLRRDLYTSAGRWALDLGLQLPLWPLLAYEVALPQAIGQLRWYPRREARARSASP